MKLLPVRDFARPTQHTQDKSTESVLKKMIAESVASILSQYLASRQTKEIKSQVQSSQSPSTLAALFNNPNLDALESKAVKEDSSAVQGDDSLPLAQQMMKEYARLRAASDPQLPRLPPFLETSVQVNPSPSTLESTASDDPSSLHERGTVHFEKDGKDKTSLKESKGPQPLFLYDDVGNGLMLGVSSKQLGSAVEKPLLFHDNLGNDIKVGVELAGQKATISKVSSTKWKGTYPDQSFSAANNEDSPPTYHDVQGNFVKFGVPLTRLQAGKKPLFFHDHDGNAVKVEFVAPDTAKETEDEDRFRLHDRGERERPRNDYDNVLPHLLEKEGPTYEPRSQRKQSDEQPYSQQHEAYEPKHEEKQLSPPRDDGYKSLGNIHEVGDKEDREEDREKSLGSATHSLSGHLHNDGDGPSDHTAHSVLVPSFKIHANVKALPTSRSEVRPSETKVGKIVQVSTDMDTTVVGSAASPEGKVKVSQHMSRSAKRTPDKRPPVATIINESRTHHLTIAEIKKKQKDLLLRQQNSESIVKRTFRNRSPLKQGSSFQRPAVTRSYDTHNLSKRTRIAPIVKHRYFVRPRVNLVRTFRNPRGNSNAMSSNAIYPSYSTLGTSNRYVSTTAWDYRRGAEVREYPLINRNYHSRKRSPEEWLFPSGKERGKRTMTPYLTNDRSELNLRHYSPIKKDDYSMQSSGDVAKVKKSLIAHRNDKAGEDKVIAELDDDEESDEENDEVKASTYLHDTNRIISRATIATKRSGEIQHVDESVFHDIKQSNDSAGNASHTIVHNNRLKTNSPVYSHEGSNSRSNASSETKAGALGIMETFVADVVAGSSNHSSLNDSLIRLNSTNHNSTSDTTKQTVPLITINVDEPDEDVGVSILKSKDRSQTNSSAQVSTDNATSAAGVSSRQYICSIVQTNNRTRGSFPLLPTVCNGVESNEQHLCLNRSNETANSSNDDDNVERRCVQTASQSYASVEGDNSMAASVNDSDVPDTDDELNVISGFVSNATDADSMAFLKEETYSLYQQVIKGLREHIPFRNDSTAVTEQVPSHESLSQEEEFQEKGSSRTLNRTYIDIGTQDQRSKDAPIKLNGTVGVKSRKLQRELSLLKHRRRRSLSHNRNGESRAKNNNTKRSKRHHFRNRRNPNKFHKHFHPHKAVNDQTRKRTLPQAQRMELAGSVIRAALPAIAKALIQKALRHKQRNRFMQQETSPWPPQPPPVQQLPPPLTTSSLIGPSSQQQFAAPITTQYFHMPNRVLQPIQQFMPSVDETPGHGIFQQPPMVFTNQPANQQPVVYTNPMPFMTSMPQVIPMQSAPVQTIPVPVPVLVGAKPKCPIAESCVSCGKSRRDSINNSNVLTSLLLHKLMNEKINSDCVYTAGVQPSSSSAARGGIGTGGSVGGGSGSIGTTGGGIRSTGGGGGGGGGVGIVGARVRGGIGGPSGGAGTSGGAVGASGADMNIVPTEPPEELQLPPDPAQHREEGLTKKFTKTSLNANSIESNQVRQPAPDAITKISPTVNPEKPTMGIKTTMKATQSSMLIKNQNSLVSNTEPTNSTTTSVVDRAGNKLDNLMKTVDVEKPKEDERFNIKGLKVEKVREDEKYANIGAKLVNRLNEDANIGVKMVEKLKEDANIGVKVVDKLKEDANLGVKVVDQLKDNEKYGNIGVKVEHDRSEETNDEKARTENAIQDQISHLTSSSSAKQPKHRREGEAGRGGDGGELSEFDVTGGGVTKRISNGLVVIPFGAFGYPKKESKHEDEVITKHKQYGMG